MQGQKEQLRGMDGSATMVATADRRATMQRTTAMLSKGWKLLNDLCPLCVSPLMRLGSSTRCPGCDLEVYTQAQFDASGGVQVLETPPSHAAPKKEKVIDVSGGGSDLSVGDLPQSYEELKKEYDNQHKKRDKISARLGELMLMGWTLLADSCPDPVCNSNPLMRHKGGPMKCVSCDREYEYNQITGVLCAIASDPMVTSSATSITNEIPSIEILTRDHDKTVSHEDIEKDTQSRSDEFFFADAPPSLPSFRSTDVNDASAKIARHLLQGWALLDEVCNHPNCKGEVPLMRDIHGRKVCVECDNGQHNHRNLISKNSRVSFSSHQERRGTLDDNDTDDVDYDECNQDNVRSCEEKLKSMVDRRFDSKTSATPASSSKSQILTPSRSFPSECQRALHVLEDKFVTAINYLDGLDSASSQDYVPICQAADLVTKLSAAISAVKRV